MLRSVTLPRSLSTLKCQSAGKAHLTTAIEEERRTIPANREQGRRLRREHEKAVSAAKEVLNLLLAMKEQRHISLAELESRTAFDCRHRE